MPLTGLLFTYIIPPLFQCVIRKSGICMIRINPIRIQNILLFIG